MEAARLEIRFNDEPLAESGWTSDGFDTAEFFLSPNPGEDLRPLARIVSGGELSRVMLAIKTLTFRARLADENHDRVTGAGAPGLIFDEVDAGIGGRVADVVGRKLRALGSVFQVLCITHLPQIAACADAHFQIEKRVVNGRTHTSVKRLDADARVEELGRMLGGASVTDPIRASAREMLAGRLGSRNRWGDQARGESERAKGETAKGETAGPRGANSPKRGTR
jgi:DNA repair protein RecN (Recombination protein N)